jgi:hypothetical protein
MMGFTSFNPSYGLSQIGREEKAAAADEVSPIVPHRASVARLKVMGFAEPVIGPATPGRTRWLNPSYGLPKRRMSMRFIIVCGAAVARED